MAGLAGRRPESWGSRGEAIELVPVGVEADRQLAGGAMELPGPVAAQPGCGGLTIHPGGELLDDSLAVGDVSVEAVGFRGEVDPPSVLRPRWPAWSSWQAG
jgi:hypothetical protein